MMRSPLVAAAVCSLAVVLLSWSLWPRSTRRAEELPPLPDELTARAELMGKAWASNDLVTMRRLTASARGRALRLWLNSHPSPAQGQTHGESDVTCEVRLVTQRADRARLALSIRGSAGVTIEVQQNWVKEGKHWVFQPGREVRLAERGGRGR
jgi:hypothetical protein